MSNLPYPVPFASFIRVDLFPAILYGPSLPDATPGGILDARRVILTDSYALVFSDSNDGPILSHTWTLVDIEGDNRVGWTVTVEELETPFLLKRSANCGCGSRLRGIFPYQGVPYQPFKSTK